MGHVGLNDKRTSYTGRSTFERERLRLAINCRNTQIARMAGTRAFPDIRICTSHWVFRRFMLASRDSLHGFEAANTDPISELLLVKNRINQNSTILGYVFMGKVHPSSFSTQQPR